MNDATLVKKIKNALDFQHNFEHVVLVSKLSVVRVLGSKNAQTILVIKEGKLVGILTKADFL